MQAASTMFHLLSALRRAIGRVFLTFALVLVLSAAVVEGVALGITHAAPSVITHITAGVIGVLFGYSAALTVLVSEAISALIGGIQKVEQEVRGEVSGGAKILETVLQNVERRGR